MVEKVGPALHTARVELRPELCPPRVERQRIAELCAAIDRIEGLLQRGEPAEPAIAAFNADTGHAYPAEYFVTYRDSRDVEDFALEAARPARPKVVDVTRDELIEIVRRIQAVDADIEYYVLLLETNVVHPRVTDLVFWPPPELVGASPERIVDAALRYRPIPL